MVVSSFFAESSEDLISLSGQLSVVGCEKVMN
jgi:hypothetical protein